MRTVSENNSKGFSTLVFSNPMIVPTRQNIPPEIVQAVRDASRIEKLASSHVNLRRAGRELVGRCLFHEEKSASLYINPERQRFHCFGCQAGGEVFNFAMRLHGLAFPQAVRLLASESGINIDRFTVAPELAAR